jgi:hypothetical protein
MIQRLLLLSVVFFWLSSSSYSQEYTYEGNLTQKDIDQSYLYVAPNDIKYFEDGKVYMDQIIDPGAYSATTGCLDVLEKRTWGGSQEGSCANTGSGFGDTGSGVFTFGYNTTVISQTQSAIDEALKVAGITVVGYRWQWRVKNADVNMYEEQAQSRADTFIVTITVKDKQGGVLDEREWDYSEYIYNWQQKYGMHWYDPFIESEVIDTITLQVEGKDIGGWAGWYGPEFGDAAIYSIMVYEVDPCKEIPVVDPTCPGFIGETPAEDPAVKQLVIIASTGAIPLSEDELSVLESLEKEQEIYNEPTVEIPKEEKENNADALAVARNAEAAAIADAANTIENTLSATELAAQQDVTQAQSIAQQSQQSSQQSMQEAEFSQQQAMEQSFVSAGINPDGSSSSNSIEIEIQLDTDSFEIAALDNAIDEAVMNLIKLEQTIVREQVEESNQEEELNEPMSNDQEDELVAAALAGSDDEDAQAALLGFNPNFRAYQQPQMTDADFYAPKEIYEGQKNHDNPAARFFNGASDATHREMVRQQYEGN